MANSDIPCRAERVQPNRAEMVPGLAAVYDAWERLRGADSLPTWSRFDWMELPTKVIPWCTVVDVARDPLDFVYRFWGTERARLQGRDYTGKSLRDVEPDSLAEKIWGEYTLIAETAEPVFFVTTEVANPDGESFEYHFLRLPFGEGGRVTQILAVGLHEERDIKKIQNYFGTD